MTDLQRTAGNRAVSGLVRVPTGPDVQRWKPPVATPAFPPRATPPGRYAPTNERRDQEGNLVGVARGRPYLAERPASLDFATAAGADYRLFPVNPNAAYRRLRATCGRLLVHQHALAQALTGDMKYWFARVYAFVTQYTLQDVDAGVYQYPHMKLQQVIHFHETYERNLRAWVAGERGKVEANWTAAFAAADSAGSWIGESKAIGNALLPSIQAHVRLDLPRAIAAAYRLHYAGLPGASMSKFQADFFAMGSVFERANAAVAPEIDDRGSDANPFNWGWLGDVGFVFLFRMDAERRMAWEKAVTIARHYGVPRDVVERAVRAEMAARHPNLDPFEVDGTDIKNYEWLDQPGARPDERAPGPEHLQAPPKPVVPRRLYFQLDKPKGNEELEYAVRRDQDLTPLLQLAEWTRQVRGAAIGLYGMASSEGPETLNDGLADARAALVEAFLWRAGADFEHNSVHVVGFGELGARPGPEDRHVLISVRGRPVSKHTEYPEVGNLPSEVR